MESQAPIFRANRSAHKISTKVSRIDVALTLIISLIDALMPAIVLLADDGI